MEGTMSEVRLFAGNFAPRSWAFCAGQLLSIAQYNALFSLLGTTYGGDGRTTFALPDLRSRTAVGQGQGPGLSLYRLGARVGYTQAYLNSLSLPSHGHNVSSNLTVTVTPYCNSSDADSDEPEGTYAGTPSGITPYNAVGGEKMAQEPVYVGGNVSSTITGSSAGHNNMMPSLTSSYVICLYGVYPSRS